MSVIEIQRYPRACTIVSANYTNNAIVWAAPKGCAGVLQPFTRIRPMQMRNLCIALLVGVGLTIVVIECEVSIGAGVDAELRNSLLLIGAQHRRAKRQD